MRIFLSYSSGDRQRAEEIALALEAAGHRVFFDRSQLQGGEDYGTTIRHEIEAAQIFLYLVTPASVAPGSYALSELRMARERWPSPKGHVLPVLLAPTELSSVPPYLRSVTLFQPEGNAAAEVAAQLAPKRGFARRAIALAVALLLVGAALIGLRLRGARDAVDRWKVEPNEFVTEYVYSPRDVRLAEYSLDPTFPVSADWSGAVRVNRIAYGRIAGAGPAMSVDVVFKNASVEPMRLDLTPRFFSLEDDHARRSDLLYFCCRSAGDLVSPDQERTVQLLFAADPRWKGKSTNARSIQFQVNGLLPLVRGTWVVHSLATAE